MDEKKRLVSPEGTVLYAHVDKPDTRFNKEGSYTLDLACDPNENKQLEEFCSEIRALKPEKAENVPWSMNEENQLVIKFKSSYAPKMFDTNNNEIEVGESKLGRGSKVKVSCVPNVYDAFGGGVNLYLNAVQILELVPYGGSAKDFGFEEQEESQDEETVSPF